MAFEGLTDQLKERWADLTAKVQESPTFNNLREQFESQPPSTQKAILAGISLFAAAVMLYFPYSYWSQSAILMEQFEENRELIHGLLKTSRSAKAGAPLPPPMDTAAIRGRVDSVLRMNRIVPDQVGEFQDIPQPPVKDIIPAGVVQNGLAFQLKQLNLTQIVKVANDLQNMGNGVKLMGIDVVQSSGQTHYYDMIVKLVHFGLPAMDDGPAETPARPGARRPSRPSSDDEGDE